VSIRVVGCLETPTAFLEALPNAWAVTRGCLQLGVYTGARMPRNAYGFCRGSAKCMDSNSGCLSIKPSRGRLFKACWRKRYVAVSSLNHKIIT
jgi:hypothetical protein